jgi:WD40 repeat protein
MSDLTTWILDPFPGLRPFEPEHSALFFGRDEQTDELLGRLQRARFLAIVGESGSGKSSLARAGLIPSLQRGYMADAGSRWQIALFRPGNDPGGNLARALERSCSTSQNGPDRSQLRTILERSSMGLVRAAAAILPHNTNLLVVVDQFEEIFRYRRETQRHDGGDSAAAFVKLLLTAAQEEDSTVYIVLTMRSDFLGECAHFRGLPEALNGGQYLVPRLTREQKKQVIEGPAAVAGAEFAPSLVQRLLNDVGDTADQLPILQHALMRTWEEAAASRERGEPVSISHYEAVGGIDQALNRHVESAYQELEEQDREIAKKIFQRLTERGRGDRDVRRPTKVNELCAVSGDELERVIAVINKFRESGRTFLNSPDPGALNGDSVIDITHESLIRLWSTLRDWVAEEADSARLYRRLADSAVENRAAYHDQDLKQALSWREDTKPNQAWAERYHPAFAQAMEFLDLSRKLDASSRRRKTAAVAGLCITAVVAAMFAIRLWIQDRELKARELLAEAQRLQDDPGDALHTSALLAIESLRHHTFYESDLVLRGAVGLLPRALSTLHHQAGVQALAFSADGSRLATGSDDGAVTVWETSGWKQMTRFQGQGSVRSLSFSPDGQRLLAGSSDHGYLLDATTGQQMAVLPGGNKLSCLAFSPDGTRIANASGDGTIRVFEAKTAEQLWMAVPGGPVNFVAFSSNGERVASGSNDGTVRIFAASGGNLISVFKQPGEVRAVAFSPDARLAVIGSATVHNSEGAGVARVIAVDTGKETAHAHFRAVVDAVAFSTDGAMVAGGSDDGTVKVFDALDGSEFSRLKDAGPVIAIAFSPDGRWVATGSWDHTGRLFDAADGREVARLIHQDKVRVVAFSSDGRLLATGSDDHMVRIFAAGKGDSAARVPHRTQVLSSALSPTAGMVITGSKDGLVRILKADTGKEVASLNQQGAVTTVVFSSGGSLAAAATDKGETAVFETDTGRETAKAKAESAVLGLAFSPDQTRIASGYADGLVRVCETRGGREVLQANAGGRPVRALDLSSDGRLLIAGGDDHIARVWEVATGREISRFALTDAVRAVAMRPHGDLALVGGSDGTVVLFRTDTGREEARIPGRGRLDTMTFSHDGKLFAAGSSMKMSDGSTGGATRIFDTESTRELARLTQGGAVESIVFGPDDRWAAAIDENHVIHVFRTLDGAKVARIEGDFVKAARFTDDGTALLVVSTEAAGSLESNVVSLQRHPLAVPDLVREGCSRLGYNLSPDEWRSFFHNQPYRKICPDLP